jgi:sugar O-acyltransferase (sialic acid O-acetyltransferase NeuD family)
VTAVEKILLAGAGGHARACIDVIEQEGRFTIVGLLGHASEVGTKIFGYPVLGTEADLPALADTSTHAIVTVGQIKTAEPRIRLFTLLERNGWRLPTIVSPRAHVSAHAALGAGTIVMHGAIVNAGAVVGRNCILNSQSLVEHDSAIDDHCHISTAAAINSGVRVGSATFVGSNSCVRQGVRIGERCVIGMGQRVLVDCEAGTSMPPAKTPS